MDAALDAGFDIYYNAKTGTNKGFATLGTGSSYSLYEISILNGKATNRGTFPSRQRVTDIALPLNQER
ncbi:DUF4394 domain-containing protein [Streptomyces sp. NBC_01367]|uniref:DUF4394 domain-containing protein n=1 Tax=unclassified Streptomyces TaxID=2593676 RepID=UPI00386CE14A